MTTLLIDALIALTKTIDRGLTAVENVLRFRPNPPGPSDGEAPPAGVDSAVAASAADSGGHPVRTTSEVLNHAANELTWFHSGFPPAVIRALIAELRDRAANLAACGD